MRHLKLPQLAAAATILSLCCTPANANLGNQLAKILASDSAEDDRFGGAVDISGSIAIIGAYGYKDLSGSAYLFDTTDPTNPVQLFKLLPNDGAMYDQFGFSVAISGDTAIVGAFWDDDIGVDSGSAYLFDATTGQQLFKLLADDGEAHDVFGSSVAISGNTAIVGAFQSNDNGVNSGSAYLFDVTTGLQIIKLLPSDGAAGDWFGRSVAISGGTAIVGAYRNDDNGSLSGAAYLFDASTGNQIVKLLPDDGYAANFFGFSVAIDGNTAIVGTPGDNDNDYDSGSAYLFDITTGHQIAKLLPEDGTAADKFGRSVAISGTTSIVGTYLDDDNGYDSGSAYLFDNITGLQIAKLLPADGEAFDRFGEAVALNGVTAILGAKYNDDNGNSSGSAYLFSAFDKVPCPWDLDKSGSVGTSDLLELFSQWGTPGTADFDESGTVDTSDLLILFANWGPCK